MLYQFTSYHFACIVAKPSEVEKTESFCDAPASPSLGLKRAVKRRCPEDPTPPKVTAQSVATAALSCFSSMPKPMNSNVHNENNILQLRNFTETSCNPTASNHIQPQPSKIPNRRIASTYLEDLRSQPTTSNPATLSTKLLGATGLPGTAVGERGALQRDQTLQPRQLRARSWAL